MLAACFALGEVAGSKHDFSAQGWSDNAICKPCHTPHNAIETGITGRLWAHTLSTAEYNYHGTRSTSVDNTTTLDAGDTILTQNDMDGASRLCLSCHDGTVALDSFMGKDQSRVTGGTIGTAGHGSPTANLGTDLSNDHPVGFRAQYKENTQHGGHYGYAPFASVQAKFRKFAWSTTPVPAGSKDQDGNDITYTNWPSISCVTCHDVHNGTLPDEPGLLRVTNTGSEICLSCHHK